MLKENFIKLSVFLNENDEFTTEDAIDILFAYANNQRMDDISEHNKKFRFDIFVKYAFDEATQEYHSKIYDKVFIDLDLDYEKGEKCLFGHLNK